MYFIFLNIIRTGTEQIDGWHMCHKNHENNWLKKAQYRYIDVLFSPFMVAIKL